jgi:hypothetical protein
VGYHFALTAEPNRERGIGVRLRCFAVSGARTGFCFVTVDVAEDGLRGDELDRRMGVLSFAAANEAARVAKTVTGVRKKEAK